MSAEEHLKSIVNWLNKNYNQDSENYSIFNGAKPEVIRYDEHTAISLWACGAIVCYTQDDGTLLYFIEEDDGYWWIRGKDKHGNFAYQTEFSIGWAKSFANALTMLAEYTKENGTPVYYGGTKTICYHKL